MRNWILNSLAASVCLLGCAPVSIGQPEQRHPEEGVPKKLKLWIGGALGRSYWVEWDGKFLKYQFANSMDRDDPRVTVFILPTREQWSQFWKVMDSVELWRWRARYDFHPPRAPDGSQEMILDGTSWGLQIEQAGRHGKKRRSWGTNSYPRTDDVTKEVITGEPSTVFKKFTAAVETLVGNRPF